MSTEKIPMTPEGHAALEKEVKHLKSVERPRIIKAIAEAREHGDLSENAEYHAAKEQQGMTEAGSRSSTIPCHARRSSIFPKWQGRYHQVRGHRHHC